MQDLGIYANSMLINDSPIQISLFKNILESYIILETDKIISFRTYLPYTLIKNLLIDHIQEWPPINNSTVINDYLFDLKLKNLIYIKSFYYLLEGNILYLNKPKVERAFLYKIFKNSQSREAEISSQLITLDNNIINTNIQLNLLTYKNNINFISNLINTNNIKTKNFPIPPQEYFQNLSIIENIPSFINILT